MRSWRRKDYNLLSSTTETRLPDEKWANYSPQAKSGLLPVSVNQLSLEQSHSHFFMDRPSLLLHTLQQQGGVVLTNTVWPAWPLQEKYVNFYPVT